MIIGDRFFWLNQKWTPFALSHSTTCGSIGFKAWPLFHTLMASAWQTDVWQQTSKFKQVTVRSGEKFMYLLNWSAVY
jgi:hypothetical protein